MEIISAIFEQSLWDLGIDLDRRVAFERPNSVAHGDYATNIALQVFPRLADLGLQTLANSPRTLAEKIVEAVQKRMREANHVDTSFGSVAWNDVVAKLEIAGPGFINITVALPYYWQVLRQVIEKKGDVFLSLGSGQPAVVEYSSPNIAKPFTIGHLRSTIIGDAVANLLEASGYTVFRDNHLGDWGTQFGKLIYAIKTWGDETVIAESARPVKVLVDLYVRFHAEAELDPSLEDAGRAWFKKLEDGDSEARRLWQLCIDWSWQEFEGIYSQLGVKFTENGGRGYGESHFEHDMTAVVDELTDKKLLVDSQGAKIVNFPNEELPPLMIMKQDGATLYATRDLATDAFRLKHYGKDVLIINEVGAEQALYFQQLYRTEELLGWTKPGQRVHVKHGLYRFKDHKMSTRKGNAIWMEDVISEAVSRATLLSKDAKPETVEKIAIGALKWNDLKRGAHLDVVFDWDELLSLRGNSGPYLQYTFVRVQSVLEKAGIALDSHISIPDGIQIVSEEERLLLGLFERFPLEVASATKDLAPHTLCTYLFTFAQSFNAFYDSSPILSAETEVQKQFRLALTVAAGHVLSRSLQLLGIPTVQRM